MKGRYIVLSVALIGLMGVLGACGQKKASSSQSSTDQSFVSEPSRSLEEKQEAAEVLIGVVKESGTKENQRLVLKSLVPEDKESETIPFDEVVLLTEGVLIVDGNDQTVPIEKIEAGATIEVTLLTNSPVASSLPPQIPGMSMVKIVVP